MLWNNSACHAKTSHASRNYKTVTGNPDTKGSHHQRGLVSLSNLMIRQNEKKKKKEEGQSSITFG